MNLIKHGTVKYPRSLSTTAVDFIEKALVSDGEAQHICILLRQN